MNCKVCRSEITENESRVMTYSHGYVHRQCLTTLVEQQSSLLREAKEALKRYGGHYCDNYERILSGKCSCGYSEILAKLEEGR